MQLYLVRHGQSTNNAGHPRVVDPNLTEIGVVQATATGEHFQKSNFDARFLYTSPMRRALQTTLRVKEPLGISPFVHPDVCETGGLSVGRGMVREEIEAEFPGYILNAGISEEGWAHPDLHKEIDMGATLRAMRLWDMLCQRHADKKDRVIMVSHGDFGGFLLSYLFEAHPQKEEFFNLYNCSVSLIEVGSGANATTLTYVNSIEHLPLESITR